MGHDGPIEETAVRRVSRVPTHQYSIRLGLIDSRIDSMGDEGMVIVLDCFDDVGEGHGSVDHG